MTIDRWTMMMRSYVMLLAVLLVVLIAKALFDVVV